MTRRELIAQFSNGQQPQGADYAAWLDAVLLKDEDKKYFGLKSYDPSLAYEAGQACLKDGQLLQAVVETGGAFNAAHWSAGPNSGSNRFGLANWALGQLYTLPNAGEPKIAVSHLGRIFTVKVTNTGEEPGVSLNWQAWWDEESYSSSPFAAPYRQGFYRNYDVVLLPAPYAGQWQYRLPGEPEDAIIYSYGFEQDILEEENLKLIGPGVLLQDSDGALFGPFDKLKFTGNAETGADGTINVAPYLIRITRADLITLRDNNELTPGQEYLTTTIGGEKVIGKAIEGDYFRPSWENITISKFGTFALATGVFVANSPAASGATVIETTRLELASGVLGAPLIRNQKYAINDALVGEGATTRIIIEVVDAQSNYQRYNRYGYKAYNETTNSHGYYDIGQIDIVSGSNIRNDTFSWYIFVELNVYNLADGFFDGETYGCIPVNAYPDSIVTWKHKKNKTGGQSGSSYLCKIQKAIYIAGDTTIEGWLNLERNIFTAERCVMKDRESQSIGGNSEAQFTSISVDASLASRQLGAFICEVEFTLIKTTTSISPTIQVGLRLGGAYSPEQNFWESIPSSDDTGIVKMKYRLTATDFPFVESCREGFVAQQPFYGFLQIFGNDDAISYDVPLTIQPQVRRIDNNSEVDTFNLLDFKVTISNSYIPEI